MIIAPRNITTIRNIGLTLLASTMISFTVPVYQAEAQSLLERLFNGGQRNRRREERRRNYNNRDNQAQIRRKRVPAKVVKIKTAQYYNYRTDALKKVSFKLLTSRAQNTGDPGTRPAESIRNRMLFAESLGYLAGFTPKARKDVTKAVLTHYRNNPGFLWVADKRPNAAAISVMRLFLSAREYGLDPDDYQVDMETGTAGDDAAMPPMAEAIRFEMLMSLRVLRYALDAGNGRVNPNRLSGYHDFPKKPLTATRVMATLSSLAGNIASPAAQTESSPVEIEGGLENRAKIIKINADDPALKAENQENFSSGSSGGASEYLLSLHPTHPSFPALKAELATLRTMVDDSVVIASNILLRPGKSHAELPNIVRAINKRGSAELLARYQPVFESYDDSELYAPELVELVKDFQKENRLRPDGIIGRNTIAKMSGTSVASRVDRVILAMERLRWHPRDFGDRHVFINQPAYTASYIEDDIVKLSMRVVVGKRSNQTNFFYDEIERVVYNPYWGVPRSILVNEMLPKLRRNPSYLDQSGFEISKPGGRKISSASVDWYSVGQKFGYNVRQKPGAKNALGELKILFPNKHNIYMHDTPTKSLFNRPTRAYSHGCIRLQQPRKMAAAVLGTNMSVIKRRLQSGTNTQNLKVRIPVYVAYFTAWKNNVGKIQYYYDMYGRDKQLLKALKKTSAARGNIRS